MTQRLPIPGGDDGTWGDILNGFLGVSLNADGTLQTAAISQAGGEVTSNKGIASGYASLNSSGLVPTTQLATGTASSSNYLRGDGTWVTPNSGSSTLAADTDVAIVSPANNQVLTYNSGAGKWENIAPAVASVFGRTGTITATSGDYTASQVTGALVNTNNLSDVSDAGSSRANIHVPVLTPAAVVAIANISLSSPGATIDGYSFTSGDLFLLTAQSTSSQNGLWTWNGSAAALTRPTEFATGSTIKGRTIEIQNGTVYAGTTWVLTTATAGIVIDTGSQSWALSSVIASQLPTSSANTIRATTGVPTFLSTDQNGDFAIDTTARVIYGPAASGAWPAGYYYGYSSNDAADYGYVGLTMRPEAAQGFVGGGSGNVWFTRFTAVGVGPVNHIDYYNLVAGASLTSNECFLGIYDTGQANAGEITLLGHSVDQSTVATGTGMLTANLTTPLTLVAGNDYYAAVMFNGSTIPTMAGSGSSQTVEFNNPAAANRMAWKTGVVGGPNSSLPATLSDIGYGADSANFLLGIRA